MSLGLALPEQSLAWQNRAVPEAPRTRSGRTGRVESKPSEKRARQRQDPPILYVALVKAMGVNEKPIVDRLIKELRSYGFRRSPVHIQIATLFPQLPVADLELRDRNTVSTFDYYMNRMDYGDRLREENSTAICGILAISEISKWFQKNGLKERRLFLIDSLMHPEEVTVLRRAYGKKLLVVAVTEDSEARMTGVLEKLHDLDEERDRIPPDCIAAYDKEHEGEAENRARALMRREQRDADWASTLPRRLYLQYEGSTNKRSTLNVGQTFKMADLFVNASDKAGTNQMLSRAIRCLFGDPHPTPTIDEAGMAHAFVAQRSSGSLARRVGAAILTTSGEMLATGFNEVPSPRGGPYYSEDAYPIDSPATIRPMRDGEYTFFDSTTRDDMVGVDPNDRIKLELIADIVRHVRRLWPGGEPGLDAVDIEANSLFEALIVSDSFHDSRILDVIEYSRSVHAEMHALMQAARLGVAVKGATLYTTTFPCHECARHIVASGIRRVVFLEAFPKSRVAELHNDSIRSRQFTGPGENPRSTSNFTGRITSDLVEIEPYVGVSPGRQGSLYSWLERKSGLKDDNAIEVAGKRISWEPSPVATLREEPKDPSFREMEARTTDLMEDWARDVIAAKSSLTLASMA